MEYYYVTAIYSGYVKNSGALWVPVVHRIPTHKAPFISSSLYRDGIELPLTTVRTSSVREVLEWQQVHGPEHCDVGPFNQVPSVIDYGRLKSLLIALSQKESNGKETGLDPEDKIGEPD